MSTAKKSNAIEHAVCSCLSFSTRNRQVPSMILTRTKIMNFVCNVFFFVYFDYYYYY